MKRARAIAIVTVTALAAIAGEGGCSSDPQGSGASGASASSFPKLADYDRACGRDADCALVRGEGCISCDRAALAAKAAQEYAAAYAAAEKDPACQKKISVAAPCIAPDVQARCEALVCVARGPSLDAGADASPSDAAPE